MKDINIFTILSIIQFFVLAYINYNKPDVRISTADIIWTISILIIFCIFVCSDLIYSKIKKDS